jgi:formylglycine-generating enzyme required for sulfatase activity
MNVEELIYKVKGDVEKYCIEQNLSRQTPTAYTKIEGTFLIPAYKVERKDKKNVSKPGFSGIPGKARGGLESDSIVSKQKIKNKKSYEDRVNFTDNQRHARNEKNKRKQYTIFLSILLIILVSLAIFIKVKMDNDAEIRKRDNQAYEKVLSEDTKDSYGRYISQHPSGWHLEKAQKRLEELKEMPPVVYRLHLAPKIEVSKNKKGYWETHYKGYGILMVYIPGGNFKMGQTGKEKEWLIKNVGKTDYNKYYKNETPEHDVFLSGYWIGKTEVTNEQYVMFLNDSGIDHKDGCQRKQCIDTKKDYRFSHILGSKGNYYVESGYKNHPVTDISWYGAVEYCTWLSKKTGFDFKLPTEAQWEKAARWLDGVDEKRGFMFPWGDQEPGKTLANFNSEKIATVDSYHEGASPYGLLNMAGNVWEWCSDWYDGKYYSKSPKENPPGPKNGKYRVRRGGGWNNMAVSLRCAGRKEDTPSKRYSNVGFRLGQDLKDVVKKTIQLP